MPQITKHPTAATLSLAILPEFKSPFVEWQAKFNAIIAGSEGFVSLEFLSPSKPGDQWKIVQRFNSKESVSNWQNSKEYHNLLKELSPLVKNQSLDEREIDESCLKNGVTEVIITKINPKKEKAYRLWCAKIHRLEAEFEGFRGVYIQSPAASKGNHWITLLQFDTPENLDRWLNSKERQSILKEASALITALESHRMISPFAGWFYSIAKTEEIPAAWQQAMIVLLALFPIVILEMKYLSPLTSGLNPSLATFIGNLISVGLVTFPMIPLVIRSLSWWLFPKEGSKLTVTVLGTLFILFLYAIEIIFFSNFF